MTETAAQFDPAPAATALATAWRNGTLLSELPGAVRPRSLNEGYDIQDCLIQLLDQPTIGWKLGMGSVLQKRQSGIGRSIAGRILKPFVFGHNDVVPLPNDAPATIEFEIAYVLARDVLPGEAALTPLEYVTEVRVAFEVVLSRYVDRRAVGWPSFAADNGAFQALILGEAVERTAISELAESLVVTLDGQEAARSVFGDDATDPVEALADLMATARERNMVLPKGSIVSTGTLSKPFTVKAPSSRVTARFLDTSPQGQ
jgi:2-keto-4-pentenoate hydratase